MYISDEMGIVIGIVILIIVIAAYTNYRKTQKKIEKENEEMKNVLYRYKDYEAKGINSYNIPDEERLIMIYKMLGSTDRQKLIDYADNLMRRSEKK